jgi:hypothetical protein
MAEEADLIFASEFDTEKANSVCIVGEGIGCGKETGRRVQELETSRSAVIKASENRARGREKLEGVIEVALVGWRKEERRKNTDE